MPRTARVLLDGGYYHILTRGIDKRILFYCAQDYSYFLEVMKEYLELQGRSLRGHPYSNTVLSK